MCIFMLDYLGIVYKDSDYTVTVAIVHWPKHIVWFLKLALVVVHCKSFCVLSTAIAQVLTSLFAHSTGLRQGQRRCWLHCHGCHCVLMPTSKHPGGEVVSTGIIFFVFFLATIAHLTQTAWLSCDMCINWNVPSAIHIRGFCTSKQSTQVATKSNTC